MFAAFVTAASPAGGQTAPRLPIRLGRFTKDPREIYCNKTPTRTKNESYVAETSVPTLWPATTFSNVPFCHRLTT